MGGFFDAEEKQIVKMWEINYFATYFLIRDMVPHLKKQPGSAILIVSSYLGYELMPNPIGHYGLTKTALLGLTKVLAKELLDDEIRVNGICPGIIKTEFSKELWKNGEAQTAESMGVKRLGVPMDIGHLAKFLLSDEASYITGENIVAAGKVMSRL